MNEQSVSVVSLTVREFLTLRHLPGRLSTWQTATLLGMDKTHLPVLMAARLLKPLGNPPANAPKYFARDCVLGLASNERWLARASNALVDHWATRNKRKTSGANQFLELIPQPPPNKKSEPAARHKK